MSEIIEDIKIVKYSIKTKLSVLIVALEVVSLFAFLTFSVNLFNDDKSAYILESSLSNVESLSNQLINTVSNLSLKVKYLGDNYRTENKINFTKKFKDVKGILEFSVYQSNGGEYLRIHDEHNSSYLKKYGVHYDFFEDVVAKTPINFAKIQSKEVTFENTSIAYGPAHITISLFDKLAKRFYISRFSINSFIELISSNRVFNTYGIDLKGKLVIHKDSSQKVKSEDILNLDYITEILTTGVSSGVREYINNDNMKMIVAFNKISKFDLIFFSEISKSKAFIAVKEMRDKTILFGLAIIFLSISLAFLMSRSLTRPLINLFDITKYIAAGDFSKKSNVKSNDEIGVLASSFNLMVDKISFYIEEVKEKARMQSELEVAKLVQDAFFPSENREYGDIKLSGYYLSASECGGDWWGSFKSGDKVVTMIGDATGHGVPAALVTATINGCSNLVVELAENDKSLLESSARLMELLNTVVLKVGGKIHMTFFIAILDVNTNIVNYANASHNPPFFFKGDPANPKKSDFELLISDLGNRLGHKAGSTYHEQSLELEKGNTLILYTDGLIEAANHKNSQWGKRRFVNSTLSVIDSSVEEIKNKIITDAFEFYDGVPPDDDITLVVMTHA